jgi:Zn-dependent peptidase ImmA (M78 family)/transcriptional regulator with XRE-family HTH domain
MAGWPAAAALANRNLRPMAGRTPEALVEPALLAWGRNSIGLEVADAARRIGVTEERLEQWESGKTRPTIAQLRGLAAVYQRPLAVFFLSEPPAGFQALRDFRRLPDTPAGTMSPALHVAVQRAHAVREAAIELRAIAEDSIGEPPRLERASRDPEMFGAAARELLGVSLATQVSWADPGRALGGWIDALTELDVLVLQVQAIPIEEMRGFSVPTDLLPVVVLNGADAARGRMFTLLHEFMHVLLGAEGLCDLHTVRSGREADDEIEIFCNQAAAAALMPADSFANEHVLQSPPRDGRWAETTLEGLSERYSVSQEAVLRRLYALGLTSWDYLHEKTAEFRLAYAEAREEKRRRHREKAGGPSYYRMKVRDLGRAYIGLALDAYHRREITGPDLFEFLEIKVSQISKLEEELALTGRDG